jgi:hypothetical protein
MTSQHHWPLVSALPDFVRRADGDLLPVRRAAGVTRLVRGRRANRPQLRVLHLSNSQRSAAPHVCSTLRRGGGAFVFRPLKACCPRGSGAPNRRSVRIAAPRRAGEARLGTLARRSRAPCEGRSPIRRSTAAFANSGPHLRAPGWPGAVQRAASRTSARNGRGASPGRPSAGLTKSRPQETAPRSACRWSSGRRPQVRQGLK